MGGNKKFRALRLKEGNFGWASEGVARQTRIVDVVYNAVSNEMIRTKTWSKVPSSPSMLPPFDNSMKTTTPRLSAEKPTGNHLKKKRLPSPELKTVVKKPLENTPTDLRNPPSMLN